MVAKNWIFFYNACTFEREKPGLPSSSFITMEFVDLDPFLEKKEKGV